MRIINKPLSLPPAIGYEFKTGNSNPTLTKQLIAFCKSEYTKNVNASNENEQKKEELIQYFNNLSDNGVLKAQEGRIQKVVSITNTSSNCMKLFGAIPLFFGQIIGIIRIYGAIKADACLFDKNANTPDESKMINCFNRFKFIARGCTEILGLGIIFVPIDVITTLGRIALRIQFNDSKKLEA